MGTVNYKAQLPNKISFHSTQNLSFTDGENVEDTEDPTLTGVHTSKPFKTLKDRKNLEDD